MPSAISGLSFGPGRGLRRLGRRAGEQSGGEPRLQIEDAVADRDAALRLAAVAAKDAERQILDRKIAVRRDWRIPPSFAAWDRAFR